jgi:L,D-peptidoglycan transpeptidase YkuD (ErfK/YbiS/YcfS/YnhG family)
MRWRLVTVLGDYVPVRRPRLPLADPRRMALPRGVTARAGTALAATGLAAASALAASQPALAAPAAPATSTTPATRAAPATQAGPVTGAPPVTGAAPPPAPPPAEVITVTAASHTTTYATLRAYRVSGGKRILALGPWQARVGYSGIARSGTKREGDGKTPSGSYGFSFFFGVQPNPGFAFPFRHAFRYDVWDDDSSSPRYNEWVDDRKVGPGAEPEPMHQVPAYDYAAVIAYNTKRIPGRGSAIFLHVGTDSATAGCVSLPRAELIRILHWLRPRDHPEITISAR